MVLKALELKHMERIVEERNNVMETLRTPFKLNTDMQKEYFYETICNRNSNTFYWAVYDDRDNFLGYGGIENLETINSIGELSLLVFEKYRNKGHGKKIVDLFLDNAFNYLGLMNVYLECYMCNTTGLIFWERIIKKYNAFQTILPNRKYYKGEYHDSIYANISKDDFNG